jgi:hypothetical protein
LLFLSSYAENRWPGRNHESRICRLHFQSSSRIENNYSLSVLLNLMKSQKVIFPKTGKTFGTVEKDHKIA